MSGTTSRKPLANGRKRKWQPPTDAPLVFKPRETWTDDFVCLSKQNVENTPSQTSLMELKEAGLGRKKVTFSDKLGNFSHVKITLEEFFS